MENVTSNFCEKKQGQTLLTPYDGDKMGRIGEILRDNLYLSFWTEMHKNHSKTSQHSGGKVFYDIPEKFAFFPGLPPENNHLIGQNEYGDNF